MDTTIYIILSVCPPALWGPMQIKTPTPAIRAPITAHHVFLRTVVVAARLGTIYTCRIAIANVLKGATTHPMVATTAVRARVNAHHVFLRTIVVAARLGTIFIRGIAIITVALKGATTRPMVATTAVRAQANAPRVLLLLTALVATLAMLSTSLPVNPPAH